MRLFLILLFAPLGLFAQPGPPSFCFVLAEDRDALRPFSGAVHVVQHYRERVPYVGVNGTWLKAPEALVLQSGPFFRDSTERWLVYRPREGMAESYLIIAAGPDTMRIDLPEDQTALWQQAIPRGGSRDTPEVIRFRTGAHIMERVIVDPWAVRAAHILNERHVREERRAYEHSPREQEELQRAQERERPAPIAKKPSPSPTAEEIEREIAQRPGLKRVKLDRVDADTVWVKLTGRVMLNGDCGSNMPLWGIEMRVDTGWAERLPFGLKQMCCGMPWVDWKDHVVRLPPLRWWVAVHQPEGQKELLSGTYRLFFVGADLVRMSGEEFVITAR